MFLILIRMDRSLILRIFVFIFLVFGFGCLPEKKKTKKVSYSPPVNPYLEQLVDDYDQYVQMKININATPGAAVAIVYDGKNVLSKGYGVKKAGMPDSINSHTVFRIGSLSKGFAAVLTGILVDEHQLTWNDPVIKYLPDFKLKNIDHTRNLTVKHVLSHTTGLPRHAYTNLIEDGMSLKEIIKRLSRVSLISRVGELYSYQNVSYSLISEILTDVSGKSYEKLLNEKIFKPLEMKNASSSYNAILKAKNKALPHKKRHNQWHVEDISKKYYNASPAGGINASISDMAEWLNLLIGNSNIIRKETLDKIYTPVVNTPIEYRYFDEWNHLEDVSYGMGWRILNYNNQKVIYHGGYVNGYRSEIALIPEKKIGICVLTNSLNEFSNICIPRFFDFYEKYADSMETWSNPDQAQ